MPFLSSTRMMLLSYDYAFLIFVINVLILNLLGKFNFFPMTQERLSNTGNWKDWYWSANFLVTWCEQLSHWKRHWCWEKDWRQKENKASKDEMAGQHHQCKGHELGQTLGDGKGQRGLECCIHGVAKRWEALGKWTTYSF